jgi:hypothetical protein
MTVASVAAIAAVDTSMSSIHGAPLGKDLFVAANADIAVDDLRRLNE